MKIQGLDKHPEPATSQLLFSVFTSFALVPKSNLPILVYWRSLLEKNFIFQSHFVYVFRYSFRYFFVSSEISVCVKDHLFGKARNVYRNTKCISLVMLSGGDFFVFVIFVYRVEKEKKITRTTKTSSQSRVCYFTARPGTYPLQSSISSRSPPSSPYHRRVHCSSLEMFATFGLFGADGGRLNTLSVRVFKILSSLRRLLPERIQKKISQNWGFFRTPNYTFTQCANMREGRSSLPDRLVDYYRYVKETDFFFLCCI